MVESGSGMPATRVEKKIKEEIKLRLVSFYKRTKRPYLLWQTSGANASSRTKVRHHAANRLIGGMLPCCQSHAFYTMSSILFLPALDDASYEVYRTNYQAAWNRFEEAYEDASASKQRLRSARDAVQKCKEKHKKNAKEVARLSAMLKKRCCSFPKDCGECAICIVGRTHQCNKWCQHKDTATWHGNADDPLDIAAYQPPPPKRLRKTDEIKRALSSADETSHPTVDPTPPATQALPPSSDG
jgi:hypothetical protein